MAQTKSSEFLTELSANPMLFCLVTKVGKTAEFFSKSVPLPLRCNGK